MISIMLCNTLNLNMLSSTSRNRPSSAEPRCVRRLMISLVYTLLALIAITLQTVSAASIDNIRISKTTQSTRIVLDTSSTPDYSLFTLNNPARIVIDIKNTRLNTPINQSIFENSAVRYLRHATRENHHLRLVFDLDYQTVASSFILAPSADRPHRLVIDLKAQASQQVKVTQTKTTASKTLTSNKKAIPCR